MAELTLVVSQLLIIAGLGVGVRLLTTRFPVVPFPIVLVIVGLLLSLLPLRLELPLSHDILFFLILPPILFAGALQLDYDRLRQNAPLIALLLIVGLPIAIFIMGFGAQYLFSFPLTVALLLGAMLYPLDPIAILSVFKEMDAPDRLLTIIKGEPLFDDGLAVVFFTVFLGLSQTIQNTGESLGTVLTLGKIGSILSNLVITSIGGVVIGVVFAAIAVGLSGSLAGDAPTDVLLTVLVAYGSMLVAEHYLHLSGILAVVTAGIAIGVAGDRELLTSDGRTFVQSTWDEADLLANTWVYILIGAHTQISALIDQAGVILLSTVLFLIARAGIVYGLTPIANRWLAAPVPMNYRHIFVWGALHTVVPIALALDLPTELSFASQLQTIVFGVAIVSILLQGLSMPYVLRGLNINDIE